MTSKEALKYLDDIAHGRKMNLDPYELELIVRKDLNALIAIKALLEEYDKVDIDISTKDFVKTCNRILRSG